LDNRIIGRQNIILIGGKQYYYITIEASTLLVVCPAYMPSGLSFIYEW